MSATELLNYIAPIFAQKQKLKTLQTYFAWCQSLATLLFDHKVASYVANKIGLAYA